MKLPYNEFLALVYADLFDFPLTRKELKVWSITLPDEKKERAKVFSGEKAGRYFYLPNRKKLPALREQRLLLSQKKIRFAQTVATMLCQIPFVRAVFLTGSVAMENAKEEADIDLMIITLSKTVWIGRLMVVFLLKLNNLYRNDIDIADKVCTNIYLDSNHLEIKKQSLYNAHEILQVHCLVDKDGVARKWLLKNAWVKRYLPNGYSEKLKGTTKQLSSNRFLETLSAVFLPLELLAFLIQFIHMKPKVTNEKIGFSYAFFHPQDLAKEVEEKFNLHLRKLL